MGKAAPDAVIDAMLAAIAAGNILTVCSAQPTNRTQAVSTYALADIAMTPGNGNGDYVIADNELSAGGRKLTVAAQIDVPVDTSGTANHIAICDGTNLLYVTTCTAQAIVSGNAVVINAFNIRVGDPT